MSGAVVLVPSSKAKAPGGGAPTYGDAPSVLDHPLGKARSEALDRLVEAAEELDDHGIARLCGVPAERADDHRDRLKSLPTAPTLPARRRYTGIVHRNAGLADVPVTDDALRVGILGGLLGVAWSDEAVPDYRIEVTGRVPGLGVLGTWWREALTEHLAERAEGRLVYDLLPQEHARMWPTRQRAGMEVVEVRFRRPDGRAAPSASTKVAKGRLLRALLDHPGAGPEELAGAQLPGWTVTATAGALELVQDG